MSITLEVLSQAVAGQAAAFQCITDYQPIGGPGDKVFPPTYEGGQYATEKRVDPETNKRQKCVLLDSVQSQANRMEIALLEAHRSGNVKLPLVVAHFDQDELLKKFVVTSLEAPHRVADALFRDCTIEETIFRKSEVGRVLDTADIQNATGLFGICPTALVFGIWDSTGPRGGLGAKFQRAIVSEIIGFGAVQGCKTSSRIDPASITLSAGPLYERNSPSANEPEWTLDADAAVKDKSKPQKFGKDGKPSNANHGNVTPTVEAGGFTISKARQTTTVSLSVLRRLRFPLDGTAQSDPKVDQAARDVLAALGLTAGTLIRSDGNLRSRCDLFPVESPRWILLDRPGTDPESFELTNEQALELLNQAVKRAQKAGLPWSDEINLTPSPELVELVLRSQKSATDSSDSSD